MLYQKLVKSSHASNLHQWLFASCCFSLLLLSIRVAVTQSISYVFLGWNLFLAFVPYAISWWIMRNVSVIGNRFKFGIALFAWLLFIPNSFYIITDFYHLSSRSLSTAPKWFDLLLLFSFAWNGIVCGILSLRRIEMIVLLIHGKRFSVFLVFAVMWLSAFGIYIGRFLRFNSWDIITDPFSLLTEITDMIIRPFGNTYGWGMTFCYAIFMTLVYFTVKKFGEASMFRMQPKRS